MITLQYYNETGALQGHSPEQTVMWHQLNVAKACAASKSLNFDMTNLPTLIGVTLGAKGAWRRKGTNTTPIFFYVRIFFLNTNLKRAK
jgi:hypothetical protein